MGYSSIPNEILSRLPRRNMPTGREDLKELLEELKAQMELEKSKLEKRGPRIQSKIEQDKSTFFGQLSANVKKTQLDQEMQPLTDMVDEIAKLIGKLDTQIGKIITP
ncbi:uncharacterized protein LOC110860619 [Folsomia candida]|uniref:Uncharacterized protein n=1 Tax=Folsomia candida TaxID=158441 RepID=A0A226D8B6_FOLCA|nr:uncharacterized protein LOC110860619 [Folsomia candida]OXA40486.1 hypothetical protein Fcan01_24809 [Folsomia candida]